MGGNGRFRLQVREATGSMSEPNRTHEKQAIDVLAQLENGRANLSYVVAVVGASISHAVLDLAQAIREGHRR